MSSPKASSVARNNCATDINAPSSSSSHHHSIGMDWSTVDYAFLQSIDPRVGLTDAQVAHLHATFGYNELPVTRPSRLRMVLSYFTNSIALLIEAAALLSAVLHEWLDLSIILALLLLNAAVGFLSESRSEAAITALQSTLALRARTLRSSHLHETPARNLVPGDVLLLRTGDVVPADALLLPRLSPRDRWDGFTLTSPRPTFHITRCEGGGGQDEADVALSVDQSAITGESLPRTKRPGDLLLSSSLVKAGHGSALVTHTGALTFVGRAAHLIAVTPPPGHFQKLMQRIGYSLIVTTLVCVVTLFVTGVLLLHHHPLTQLRDCLVLTIASIPVALPVVLTVTLAVGAGEMAQARVVVKQLTAVEELASIDILCSDKTGTLTRNQLTVDRPYVCEGSSEEELMETAFLATEAATNDAIDCCLRAAAVERVPRLRHADLDADPTPGHHLQSHYPFNSTSKVAYSTLRRTSDGRIITALKGAPHVIFDRSSLTPPHRAAAEAATEDMARRGLRALAVAVSEPSDRQLPMEGQRFHCQGCVSLLDPPRADSAATIKRLKELGVGVKMITGDAITIAREVAKRLGLQPLILSPDAIRGVESDPSLTSLQLRRLIERADGFAQTIPEDKHSIVQLLQRGGHIVGMTGDGVNDAPALKRADCGIAVHEATDAARAAAAVVLLEPGLKAIADGVVTSRRTFQKMRSYALYRVAATVHFLLFFLVAILAFDFTLPSIAVIILVVLNDMSSLVVAWDDPTHSARPERWNVARLVFLSFTFGGLLAASSLAHLLIARSVLRFSPAELSSLLFLQLAAYPHSLILSTRLPTAWYTRRPPWVYLVLTAGSTVVVGVLCGVGVGMERLGWGVVGVVVVGSLVFVAVVDVVKVAVYSRWEEVEDWARCRRGKRREEGRRVERVKRGVRRLRRVLHALWFVHSLRAGVEGGEEEKEPEQETCAVGGEEVVQWEADRGMVQEERAPNEKSEVKSEVKTLIGQGRNEGEMELVPLNDDDSSRRRWEEDRP